jgi:hypothetical protein
VPETAEDRPSLLVRFLQHNSSLWRVVQLPDRTLSHRYPHGEWWYLNAAILDAIRDDCRKAGVPVLFVYIPTRGWRAFPSLRAYMLRNQADFIDLSQGEFALAPNMYIPRDGHLNDKGHRRVADAVLRWLQAGWPALSVRDYASPSPIGGRPSTQRRRRPSILHRILAFPSWEVLVKFCYGCDLCTCAPWAHPGIREVRGRSCCAFGGDTSVREEQLPVVGWQK